MTEDNKPSTFEIEKWRAKHSLEIEKWQADVRNQEREHALKERAQKLSEEELVLKREETKASRWSSPIVLAIIGATLAGIANAGVALLNNTYQLQLEERKSTSTIQLETLKSEASRIFEMIKTGNSEQSTKNLNMLANSGLISDPDLISKLKAYLSTLKPEAAPVLPINGPTQWSFPSDRPGSYLVCDHDPATGQYNRNCTLQSR
jgi:hypothetical protein